MSMSLSETYLRADQEWRIARSKSIVEHRGEGSDLVISAVADVETEALMRERLEALVAYEDARDEREQMISNAHGQVGDFYGNAQVQRVVVPRAS